MLVLTRYPELDGVLKLGFEPIVNPNPRAFTPAQVEQFNAWGFVEPVQLYSGNELRRLQQYFRETEPEINDRLNKAGGFLSLHHLMPGLYDIVTWPRTVAYLRDLIGPNVICHTSQFINKPPGQTKGGSHHQDATFNAIDARCVVVWVAIEDADVENGCMWFIPGSHRHGVVECDREHYVVNPLQFGREVPCEVRAGHAVFMSDLLMHSSPANRSASRYRPAFTASYAAAELQPRQQLHRWAVQCSGIDPRGYWKSHVRPSGVRLFS